MLAPNIDTLVVVRWEPIDLALDWLDPGIWGVRGPPAISRASFVLVEDHPNYSLLPRLEYLDLKASLACEDWLSLADGCPNLKHLELRIEPREGLADPDLPAELPSFPNVIYLSARVLSTKFRARRTLRMVLINTNYPKLSDLNFSTYGLTVRDMDDIMQNMGRRAALTTVDVEFRSQSARRTPLEMITPIQHLLQIKSLTIRNSGASFLDFGDQQWEEIRPCLRHLQTFILHQDPLQVNGNLTCDGRICTTKTFLEIQSSGMWITLHKLVISISDEFDGDLDPLPMNLLLQHLTILNLVVEEGLEFAFSNLLSIICPMLKTLEVVRLHLRTNKNSGLVTVSSARMMEHYWQCRAALMGRDPGLQRFAIARRMIRERMSK